MKQKKSFGARKKSFAKKKNPGRKRRLLEKEQTDLLRGSRIPSGRLIPDKRRKDTEARLEKERRSC